MARTHQHYLYQNDISFLLVNICPISNYGYRVYIQTPEFLAITFFNYDLGIEALHQKSLDYFLKGRSRDLYNLFKYNHVRYQLYVFDNTLLEK